MVYPRIFTDHNPTLLLNMDLISVYGRIMLFLYIKRCNLEYAVVDTINTRHISITLSKKINVKVLHKLESTVILKILTQENHSLRDLGIEKYGL